jgi:hypothetical protein
VGLLEKEEGPDRIIQIAVIASVDGTDTFQEVDTPRLPGDEENVRQIVRPHEFLQFELVRTEENYGVPIERPQANEGLPRRNRFIVNDVEYDSVFYFTPNGELRTDDANSLPNRMEFGIRPLFKGADNPAVFQVAGLTGITRVYRPGLN